MSWKLSLLLTCQILRFSFKTLRADEMYPILNRDNLTIPIQMQLSKKQKTFAQFLAQFLKFILNFKYLKQSMTLIDFVFPKLRTSKTSSDKRLRSPVLEDLSTSNLINVLNHCCVLRQSIFIMFIDHCQVRWAGESLFFWYSKSWDCLLSNWLPMKSILF